MCECYKVGGPFIAEDPDCPVHGWAAQREQEERQRESQALEDRLAHLEAEVAKLRVVLAMAVEAADRGDVLGSRILNVLNA